MNIQTLLEWGQMLLEKEFSNNLQAAVKRNEEPVFRAAQSEIQLEVSVLLAHVLSVNRSHLYAWPQQTVTTVQKQEFEALIFRRRLGEPIAYLTGYKEFWSLPFKVSKAVLIPRSETELVVECALNCISSIDQNVRVLDLGTGSGAIALALASERPHWKITAVDKQEAALAVAKENAKNLAITNVEFYLSDWFSHFLPEDKPFNIVVSNPPYIAPHDIHLRYGDSRYEPKEALIAKENGLDDLKKIISHAKRYLVPGGWLILEHGFKQASDLQAWMQIWHFDQIKTVQDLAGLDRVTMGQIRGK